VFGKRIGKEAVTLMALAAVGVSFIASLDTARTLTDALRALVGLPRDDSGRPAGSPSVLGSPSGKEAAE